MTPQQMANEVAYIKTDNEHLKNLIASNISKEIKAECRAKLIENNHQLMHLESTLLSLKYDPFM